MKFTEKILNITGIILCCIILFCTIWLIHMTDSIGIFQLSMAPVGIAFMVVTATLMVFVFMILLWFLFDLFDI